MSMYNENDSEEQENLLPPRLSEELAEQKINLDLLESETFSSLIRRFDNHDENVKTCLLDNFKPNGRYNQDFFDSNKNEKDYFKKMLKESIKEKLEMNVQKFIETLWDLSYGDTRRPQKDTCYDIKENEEVIINEIKAQKDLNSNKSRPGNKVWLVCDDNILDKLFMDQKNNIRSAIIDPNIPNISSIIPIINESTCQIKKTVILLYDDKNSSEVKKEQIENFKSKLKNHLIEHVDISSFFTKSDWKKELRDELSNTDAVFILYDQPLGDHFDDKMKKNEEDIRYKHIGKELYLRYFHNEFRNINYYTFLIDGCSSVTYYWLENRHVKVGDKFVKERSLFDFGKDDVDQVLSKFSKN